jgi:hypothetical protein
MFCNLLYRYLNYLINKNDAEVLLSILLYFDAIICRGDISYLHVDFRSCGNMGINRGIYADVVICNIYNHVHPQNAYITFGSPHPHHVIRESNTTNQTNVNIIYT